MKKLKSKTATLNTGRSVLMKKMSIVKLLINKNVQKKKSKNVKWSIKLFMRR